MPIGFFDKYFNEDEAKHLVLLHHAKNKNTTHEEKKLVVEAVEEEKPVLIKEPNKVKTDKQEVDMKSRILQAAQQYMVIKLNYSTLEYQLDKKIFRTKKKRILMRNMQ